MPDTRGAAAGAADIRDALPAASRAALDGARAHHDVAGALVRERRDIGHHAVARVRKGLGGLPPGPGLEHARAAAAARGGVVGAGVLGVVPGALGDDRVIAV